MSMYHGNCAAELDKGVFPKGSKATNIIDVILTKVQTTLQYKRHCRKIESDIHNSVVFVVTLLF